MPRGPLQGFPRWGKGAWFLYIAVEIVAWIAFGVLSRYVGFEGFVWLLVPLLVVAAAMPFVLAVLVLAGRWEADGPPDDPSP